MSRGVLIFYGTIKRTDSASVTAITTTEGKLFP